MVCEWTNATRSDRLPPLHCVTLLPLSFRYRDHPLSSAIPRARDAGIIAEPANQTELVLGSSALFGELTHAGGQASARAAPNNQLDFSTARSSAICN